MQKNYGAKAGACIRNRTHVKWNIWVPLLDQVRDLNITKMRKERSDLKTNQLKENQNGCEEQTEKEENVMESIMNEFSEYICDHLCKYPEQIKDQEELEEHCAEHCEHGRFHCAVLNEYNEINNFGKTAAYQLMKKYKNIVLCEECIYKSHAEGMNVDYCRSGNAMSKFLVPGDGCSCGERKE